MWPHAASWWSSFAAAIRPGYGTGLHSALDVYLRYSGNPPGKESAEMADLSATLNRLALYLGITKADRFRNTNGVYMKLMNFRRFDLTFKNAGKVGLSRGGKTEADIWKEFAADWPNAMK